MLNMFSSAKICITMTRIKANNVDPLLFSVGCQELMQTSLWEIPPEEIKT